MVIEPHGKAVTTVTVSLVMAAIATAVVKPVAMVRSMGMKPVMTVTRSTRMRVLVPVRLPAAVTTSFGTDVKSVMMVMR